MAVERPPPIGDEDEKGVGGMWHCPPHAAPPPRHRKGSEDLCVRVLERFSHERGIDGWVLNNGL